MWLPSDASGAASSWPIDDGDVSPRSPVPLVSESRSPSKQVAAHQKQPFTTGCFGRQQPWRSPERGVLLRNLSCYWLGSIAPSKFQPRRPESDGPVQSRASRVVMPKGRSRSGAKEVVSPLQANTRRGPMRPERADAAGEVAQEARPGAVTHPG